MVKAKIHDDRQLEFDILFDALPDITLRDQRDALERPLVSLSKNIQFEKVEYLFGDLFVHIDPHQSHGRPTIYDYDIIIYLLGQVNERFRQQRDGKPEPAVVSVEVSPNTWARWPDWGWEKPAITVNPIDLLRAIGRGTGGKDFKELRAAIGRLQTTQIETNIWHGRKLKRFKRFSLIHEFDELEPSEHNSGGMVFLLPDWMIESVRNRKGIFSIHPDYFNLKGGYERFLYRIARKYAGRQGADSYMKMATLHEKSGSPMELKDFAKSIRRAIAKSAIPEYTFTTSRSEAGEEIILMRWRRGLKDDLHSEDAGNDPPVIDGEWECQPDELPLALKDGEQLPKQRSVRSKKRNCRI